MRIPDPKANTTIEAYLAYKAGFLEESELKPKLYKPDWHFDGWLAYWAGLVNTYPTKENGEPEMLCDEEALVAYLSGVTDTYPEEIKDPYDVRIVGYLKHLASIRWPEPDYPVNNEEFYLSTMEPTHTSNPVPSSDIELDTAEGKIISVEAYGDTYQQTYSGKNIINNNNLAYNYSNVPSNTNELTTLPTGIRYKSTYPDGGPVVVFKLLDLTGLEGKIIRMSSTFTSGGRIVITRANENMTSRHAVVLTSVSGETISWTVPNDLGDEHFLCYSISVGAGTTIDFENLIMTIDNADMSYEPYTAGPAPNPDYPQDIQVVTGEQTVEVHGKNLWPATPYKENYYIPASGTETPLSNFSIFGNISSLPQKKYVISVYNPENWEATLRIHAYDSNGNWIEQIEGFKILSHETGTITFTTPTNTALLRWSFPTSASNATLYQVNDYPIDLVSKNLFGAADGTVTYKGVTQTLSDNNHLTIVGTATEDYPVTRNLTATLYSPIPAGTYTITIIGSMEGTATKAINMAFYDKDGTEVIGGDGIALNAPQQRVFDRPIYSIKWFRNMLSGATIDFDLRIQIEAGSSASPYVSYFTPIELCKIGTYQDYIYKSGDDWYVHKEITKAIFDGTENWATHNIYNDIYGFRVDAGAAHSDSAILASSYRAVPISVYNSNNRTYGTISTLESTTPSTYYRVFLTQPNSTINNLSSFTTWLGSHNITAYYASQTPTDTKITDATLLGQLEALAGADTYNEKTYIKVTATAPNLPALLKVEAYKY